MRETQPILLVSDVSSEVAAELNLPPDKENILQRLIRNPHTNSSKPKERECTEMLAAVLMNAPQLRIELLSWMGSSVGLKNDYWNQDNYNLQIRTEQSIDAKRDDLRIEAWRIEDDILEVLWTVEVKVGSSINYSSYQKMNGSSEKDTTMYQEEDGSSKDDISQLINYDNWLQQKSSLNPSANIAGFVLALGDMKGHLPLELKKQWACITWTQLGQQLEELLRNLELSANDEFLGKHMVGFIRKHLWRDIEMSKPTVGFDDIALIRAFSTIGSDCERKINDLVQCQHETGG